MIRYIYMIPIVLSIGWLPINAFGIGKSDATRKLLDVDKIRKNCEVDDLKPLMQALHIDFERFKQRDSTWVKDKFKGDVLECPVPDSLGRKLTDYEITWESSRIFSVCLDERDIIASIIYADSIPSALKEYYLDWESIPLERRARIGSKFGLYFGTLTGDKDLKWQDAEVTVCPSPETYQFWVKRRENNIPFWKDNISVFLGPEPYNFRSYGNMMVSRVVGPRTPAISKEKAAEYALKFIRDYKPTAKSPTLSSLKFQVKFRDANLCYVNPGFPYLSIKIPRRKYKDPKVAVLAFIVDISFEPPADMNGSVGMFNIWVDSQKGTILGGTMTQSTLIRESSPSGK